MPWYAFVVVCGPCLMHARLGLHLLRLHHVPLLPGGDALERGHHVNTIIFDKTGTLTRGKPQVTEAVLFNKQYTMQQVRHMVSEQ